MPDTSYTIYCVTAEAAGGVAGNRSFRAHDRDGRSVALHLIDARTGVGQRLSRQAAATASLDPAWVCRVVETDEWAGRILIVAEEGRGELVRERVRSGPLEVRDLVEAGVGLCDALEAAHARGVIHGSLASDCVYLAPGNAIQVAGFGYVRELRGQPDCAAPEAARGMADRRTDVYGIGAVLWEMATGEVAPEDPVPATQLRRELPLILDGIIRTALEPEPGKRFQTPAGVARALRHFLEGTATPERISRAKVEGAARGHRRKRRVRRTESRWTGRIKWLRRIAAVTAAGTLLFALYLFLMRRDPFESTSVTRLTASGDIVEAAISPDGSQVALVRQEGNGYSLWKQATSGKQPARLVPAGSARISDPAWSRDGSRIYFVAGEPGTLRSIAIGGGATEVLARGVATPRFSPDGKKIAYLRRVGNEHTVVISNPDGSGETIAHARAAPVHLTVAAWAPGGNMFGLGVFTPGEGSQILTAHLDGSFSQPLGWQQWPGAVQAAWLPGGEAVMVAGPERGGDGRIWRILYPEGKATSISGRGDYSGISLSASGKALVTVNTEWRASLWVVPAQNLPAARQVTRGEGPDGVHGLDWVGGTHLVYTSEDERGRGLWVIDAEGKNSGAIQRDSDRMLSPRGSPEGESIAFIWVKDRARHVWTMTREGKQLNDVARTGLQAWPRYSADGLHIFYNTPTDPALAFPDPAESGIWRIPRDGGRPVQVVTGPAERSAVSPDGASIACRMADEVIVAALESGEVRKKLPATDPGEIGWTPDGKAIVWARTRDRVANLWAHPLDGAEPVQLTRFTGPGTIYSFSWSRDGSAIALSRGRSAGDAVMIQDKGW